MKASTKFLVASALCVLVLLVLVFLNNWLTMLPLWSEWKRAFWVLFGTLDTILVCAAIFLFSWGIVKRTDESDEEDKA